MMRNREARTSFFLSSLIKKREARIRSYQLKYPSLFASSTRLYMPKRMHLATKRACHKFEFEFELPTELWMNILARLSVKDVLRYMCVSKTWLGIIQDPQFNLLYLSFFHKKNHPKSNITVYSEINEQGRRRAIDSSVRDSDGYLSRFGRTLHWHATETECHDPKGMSYVNGVFLFDVPGKLLLWNPTLKKCLPLANPTTSTNICVKNYLGFDSLSSDFKVARILSSPSSLQPEKLMVYAVSTKSWRTYDSIDDVDVAKLNWRMTHKHGAYITQRDTTTLHWIADHDQASLAGSSIVSFDFSTESFSSLPLPDVLMSGWDNIGDNLRFLFNLRDSLAVLDVCPSRIRIWLREMNRWIEWYSSSTTTIKYPFFKSVKNDKEHLFLFLEDSLKLLILKDGGVYSYDLVSHQTKHLDEYLTKYQYARYMGIDVESLALCDSPNLILGDIRGCVTKADNSRSNARVRALNHTHYSRTKS